MTGESKKPLSKDEQLRQERRKHVQELEIAKKHNRKHTSTGVFRRIKGELVPDDVPPTESAITGRFKTRRPGKL